MIIVVEVQRLLSIQFCRIKLCPISYNITLGRHSIMLVNFKKYKFEKAELKIESKEKSSLKIFSSYKAAVGKQLSNFAF